MYFGSKVNIRFLFGTIRKNSTLCYYGNEYMTLVGWCQCEVSDPEESDLALKL